VPISPCGIESATIRRWRRNTVGRRHRRWDGHAAADKVPLCSRRDFITMYACTYVFVGTSRGYRVGLKYGVLRFEFVTIEISDSHSEFSGEFCLLGCGSYLFSVKTATFNMQM
jgi:hypothetical protein